MGVAKKGWSDTMSTIQCTSGNNLYNFDPPYSLKNARNALKSFDVSFEYGRFARWSDLKNFGNWRAQSTSQGSISEDHPVQLPIGCNMKVSIALSRTCAAAIRTSRRNEHDSN